SEARPVLGAGGDGGVEARVVGEEARRDGRGGRGCVADRARDGVDALFQGEGRRGDGRRVHRLAEGGGDLLVVRHADGVVSRIGGGDRRRHGRRRGGGGGEAPDVVRRDSDACPVLGPRGDGGRIGGAGRERAG